MSEYAEKFREITKALNAVDELNNALVALPSILSDAFDAVKDDTHLPLPIKEEIKRHLDRFARMVWTLDEMVLEEAWQRSLIRLGKATREVLNKELP